MTLTETFQICVDFRGTFKMERQDGSSFECRIPPFSLESKHEDGNTPHGFVV
jgi:polymerase delta-interacting protein 2